MIRRAFVALFLLLLVAGIGRARAQRGDVVPRTWDDQTIATLEMPLANPIGSPKHVSAEYYYRIPVAPIYKSYPVYAPGHEPAVYLDWLKQQEPEIIWDDAGHLRHSNRRRLDPRRRSGFDAPVKPAFMSIEDVRNPAWYERTGRARWHCSDHALCRQAERVARRNVLRHLSRLMLTAP
jgi:hypothetical protein